ncbi:hypothetical protein KKG71_00710 [Patescibacteria group bacterium]|nr:hypothetical protein [Patescibacteria group bacterium]
MNKLQRFILALATPVIGLIAAYGIAEKGLDGSCEIARYNFTNSPIQKCVVIPNVHAFDLEETWWIWGLAVVVVVAIELVLFNQKLKKT